eukprot:m.174657 g.174657  ORF g.174657 m.174657 type:complete len:238 (-) comp14598_c0_seq3:22-735(-)
MASQWCCGALAWLWCRCQCHDERHRCNPTHVKTLLDHGADVNMKALPSLHKVSALHLAAKRGSTDIVTTLLDAGAKINARLVSGETALFFACEKGSVETVETLLVRGAEVNFKSSQGATALILAAQLPNNAVVLQLLQKHGAKVNVQMKNGASALSMAFHSSHLETFKQLLEMGADLDIVIDGRTLRSAVISSGKFEYIKAMGVQEQKPQTATSHMIPGATRNEQACSASGDCDKHK